MPERLAARCRAALSATTGGAALRLWTVCIPLWATLGCARTPTTFDVDLRLVDASGVHARAGHVRVGAEAVPIAYDGLVRLSGLPGPTVVVAELPGHFPEPVSLGWSDADREVTVKLISQGEGDRIVVHMGGDMMFGRRYEVPNEPPALIPQDSADAGARAVVADLATYFREADLGIANLETVVSDLPAEQAYPGKRFILRSRPESLGALEALGIDVVTFGNNHTRDYLEPGIADTLTAIADAGVLVTGGGVDRESAERPVVVDVRGLRVGVFSYTTVTGSFVNDQYPTDEQPIPPDVPAKDQWLYEARTWGFEGEGFSVPAAPRRAGSAWRLFAQVEGELDDEVAASAYASLVAVYPEVQDWVARRGHGGAAMWSENRSTAAIEALAPEVDLLLVQLHSGFQFQQASSDSLRVAARAAIDAGASAVIAHHPHVLQGLEWYKGRLIAYSLGNFIFDQDFLDTFATGFLRTIWEGDRLIDARFVPMSIVGYRPRVVADEAARAVLARVFERSHLPAVSARDGRDGSVRAFVGDRDPDSVPVHHVWERHTARLTRPETEVPGTSPFEISVAPGAVARLPRHALVSSVVTAREAAELPEELELGRDVFEWGRFEDETVDRETGGFAHWDLGYEDKRVMVGDAASGRGFLRLLRTKRSKSILLARPVARIRLSTHRLYVSGPQRPEGIDGVPRYVLRFAARRSGEAPASVRFDFYHFDDTDPTEDPTSVLVGQTEVPWRAGTKWEVVEVPVQLPETEGSSTSGGVPNMVMFYFGLGPASTDEAHLDLDDVELLEWRRVSELPPHFAAFTHVRRPAEFPGSGTPAREGASSDGGAERGAEVTLELLVPR